MKEERTICPLSMSGPADMDLVNCVQEGCAWWDEDSQQCAVLTLAKYVKKVK